MYMSTTTVASANSSAIVHRYYPFANGCTSSTHLKRETGKLVCMQSAFVTETLKRNFSVSVLCVRLVLLRKMPRRPLNFVALNCARHRLNNAYMTLSRAECIHRT